jgi:NhaA family Na+:H+ antiporter
VLLAATAVALLWANSSSGGSYDRFWATRIALDVGGWTISHTLRGWVAEGLMTLFFLVVGLEIKRELLTGELRDRRSAVLPLVASVGGMVVPAATYVAFTAGTEAATGFGIAMPTDVVFALAVLTLARGTPSGVKALLLALAIVDDLGSIVVVALVYSGGVVWPPLILAAIAFTVYGVLWRIHVRAVILYVGLGLVGWAALGEAGVSPTITGVVIAFLTPAVAFQRPAAVSEEAHRVADETVDDPEPPDADAASWLSLGQLSREAVSPLARAETLLLPWTSYVVVPMFALAFAGIDLSAHALGAAAASRVGLAIFLARVVGKPLGIAIGAGSALWLGAKLPAGVGRRHLVGIGCAAGIPFTVALYVAEISLPAGLLPSGITAILVSASVAGMLGIAVLAAWRRPRSSSVTAIPRSTHRD